MNQYLEQLTSSTGPSWTTFNIYNLEKLTFRFPRPWKYVRRQDEFGNKGGDIIASNGKVVMSHEDFTGDGDQIYFDINGEWQALVDLINNQ